MLFRFRVSLFLVFCLTLSSSICFSQNKWPNTLLWRISGNGLSKPSYLYGTIHLQDKRLFQFSDSLYNALEHVDGFALEINFTEAMDTMFSRGFTNAEDEILEKQKVKLDKKKLDKSADSILKTLGIKGENLTKKDLKKVRDYRMNKLVQRGEMQTIVDGYLYGLALRLGRWTGGIEDVVDQIDLVDELGANLTQDEVFQPEIKLRNSLDEMMKIYIDRDLQRLADYVDSKYDKRFKDELLIHRNIKMARRMDSLSALRTMFFAVGAAHLPGDSGVISLLRSRGFTVEPVFSPQSIAPEAYSSKLNAIPWKAVEGDGLYSIQMPGVPSDHNMFGELMKIKIFFDLPTMTFYMAGHTIGSLTAFSNVDQAFSEMAKRMGAGQAKIKVKNVELGGAKGKESSFDVEEGAYRVALLHKGNSIYLLMVGSSKKSNLNNPDVDRFISSFAAKDLVFNNTDWTKFSMPGKGISFLLPGTPKPNKNIDGNESDSWKLATYDFVDNSKGLYYLLQARDIKAGHFLQGDSAYFSYYKEDISKNFEKVLSEKQFTYKGWPAYKLELLMKGDIRYCVYNIIRGNRVYLLVAGGASTTDFSDLDLAFNSIEFEEYPVLKPGKYKGEGFTTTAPAAIIKAVKDSLDDTKQQNPHFTSFDSTHVISYEIFKTDFSPYYWFSNDSLFFEKEVSLGKTYEDSVIQKEWKRNGNLKAIEFVTQKPDNNMLKKTRFFVNADTLYEVIAYLPKQSIDDASTKKFFDDFKIDNEIQPTIFTRKPEKLLRALQSTDTVEFEKALTVFDQVEFIKDDLPLLHQALTKKYIKREEDYRTVNERIVDELEKLADSSTIAFISSNYKKLGKDREELKYDLMHALSNIKTKEAYSILKKLLLEDLPSTGDARNLGYSLRDSLELTKSLYPEILSLSRDSAFAQLLVNVSNEMLDSNLVSINDILPYKQVFLNHAKANLHALTEDEENWWMHRNVIPFIARFNDAESNNLLKDFLHLKEIDARYSATIALIKNNQPLTAANLEAIAADTSYRIEFYNELKKLNKLKLFPTRYATQLKIAESEIFSVGSDDDYAPSSVSFIGERTAVFMGKKQKFFLFKLAYANEDGTTFNLGITGPYSLSGGEIITSSDASGTVWDEEYSKSKLDEQFKKHLSETEEYLKKKDQPSEK